MRRVLLGAALAPALLAGCGGESRVVAPVACPTPDILSDGADLTVYRPGPVHDLTTLEFDARMTGLHGGCNRGSGDRSVQMLLTAGFAVERGAASDARQVVLPWFVAVVDKRDGQVLDRQAYRDTLTFEPNASRANGDSQQVQLNLPVSEERKAQDYRVVVSFQLTPEQLEMNRRRGPR